MDSPNLLLVSIDSLRADCVSALGDYDATTPQLDALVALGYDDRAEELRGHTTVRGAKRQAREIIDEIDAEIDMVTGEIEEPAPARGGESEG